MDPYNHRMKTPVLFLFSLLALSRVNAQFDPLAHTDHIVYDMIAFDNKLFIGGSFNSIEDTIESYGSAHYDDGQFVGHTDIAGNLIEFAVFDNELYAVGNWYFPEGFAGVVKWNGTTWMMEGGPSATHTNILVIGNYLYVFDMNGLIRRKAAGGTFEVFKDLTAEPDLYIHEAGSYQGKLCIMGIFEEVEGIPMRNIALWNGTTWESLGTGMSPDAFKAVVFQNDLYVSGIFYEVGGMPATHIAKWDGISWSDVGMSVTGPIGTNVNGIRHMAVWNNQLFAFGQFDEIGNQPAESIASWDGQQWTTYSSPHTESVLNAATVYNGRLYFSGFHGPAPYKIYGYSGPLSLQDYAAAPWEIHPNPSNGIFQLSDDYKGTPYEIRNTLGQLIRTGTSPEIDLSEQQRGVYLLQFIGTASEVIRLVRE